MADFYVYRDGEAIRLDIVDERTSVLVTFETDEEFEAFKKEVNKEVPR